MQLVPRIASCSALVLVLALHGQAAPRTESTYRESVQVGVVNVEVHVVDKKGSPITDLEAADFRLFEDDEPVDISHFSLLGGSEIDASGVAVPSSAAAPLSSEVEAASTMGDLFEGETLWLVLYIDNLNLRPVDRQRSLPSLTRFFEEDLGGTAQVMVISFDRRLRVHQPFTRDVAAIKAALAEIEASPCRGARYDDERRDLLRRVDKEGSPRLAVESFKYFADSVQHDAYQTLGAMESVLESLSGLPGRKALLHVSSGLPAVPAAELFMAVEYKFAIGYGAVRMQEWDMKDDYRELARNANLYGVTLYTWDAAGVRASSGATVHEEGYDTAQIAGLIDSDTRVNLQLPLRQLADETGGTAIINRNDPGPALRNIAENLRIHYSLGFVPAHSGDGELHTLRVEVARKGARVRHRSGYIDRSPELVRSERLQALLMFSFEDNPLKVDLTVGSSTEAEGGGFVVPLELEIPLESLVLLEEGDEHRGSLRILVALMDEKGSISEVVESPLNLRVPRARFEASTDRRWSYTHRLILNGGEHVLALGVHDEISGLTSYLRRSASVGG